MSKSWASGSSRRWRKLRLAVLVRDGWVCQLRRPDVCTGRATHVHHTLGRTVTGDEDDRYLVAACEPCNLAVGDPTKGPDPQPKPMTRW